jgi:hypothetical protein
MTPIEEASMSGLTLYTHPQSCGRIVHWMMEELGEPYDTVWLDYGTTMKAPDCLAVNPIGSAPGPARVGEASSQDLGRTLRAQLHAGLLGP